MVPRNWSCAVGCCSSAGLEDSEDDEVDEGDDPESESMRSDPKDDAVEDEEYSGEEEEQCKEVELNEAVDERSAMPFRDDGWIQY